MDGLNPPTAPLVLIGVGRAAVFVLVEPALDALMRTRRAQAFVGVAGSRSMTIHLRHLLVVILVAAVALVAPGLVPAPGTAAWWWSRIPADLLVLAVLLARGRAARFVEAGAGRSG